MATEAGMDKLTGKRDLDKVRAQIKAAGYKGETIVLIDPADFPAYHAAALVTADLFSAPRPRMSTSRPWTGARRYSGAIIRMRRPEGGRTSPSPA